MKLSIIIPTLNEEKLLAKSLQNLKTLSIPHEVIVADDRSDDRTVEIAKQHADIVVECATPKRWTIATGRNNGAKAATGDFFVFCDADAYLGDPNVFFAKALADFHADPKLVGLTGKLQVLPELETWSDRIMFSFINTTIRLTNNVLRWNQGAFGKFQMVRAEAFWKIQGYDEKLVALEDSDLFIRLAKIGHTRYDPDITVFHTARRMHHLGWPHMIWTWLINFIYATFSGKVRSKEWVPVR